MNILLILPDQQRADFVGFAGTHPVRTPNLDRLAARGVSFSRAWTPSPLCSPARACLALGRDYDRSPVRNNADNLPIDAPNFYRKLRDSGYRVGSCGKVDLLKGEMDWGLDGQHRRGGVAAFAQLGFTDGLDSGGKHDAVQAFERHIDEPYLAYLKTLGLAETHVNDYKQRELGKSAVPIGELRADEDELLPCYTNLEPTPLPDEAYGDNWIGRKALQTLETMGRSDPWFMQVNFSGPHEPMDITRGMAERCWDVEFSLPRGRKNEDAPRQRRIRQRYAAMIEGVDTWLGAIVEFLDRTGQLDETFIVYTSDHGEMLGDYNLWQKTVPYEASVRVPLVIAGPEVVPGRIVDTPASLLDLIPTFFDIGRTNPLDNLDGVSLMPLLTGETSRHRDHTTSGIGSWRAITDGRYKLVLGYDEAESMESMQKGTFADRGNVPALLFDMTRDPFESTNIANAHAEIADCLRARLLDVIDNSRTR